MAAGAGVLPCLTTTSLFIDYPHLTAAGVGTTPQISLSLSLPLVQACSDPTTFGGEAGDGLRIVVATDWVFDSIGWNTMQQGSVLAFYGLIVYGVGRLVRSYVAGRRYGMVLDELVDSRDIHELLDGLYIARRRRDLLKETELYEATLRLYRSPETLLQLTGSDLKRE